MHGFACVSLPHFLQTAPFPAQSERVSTTALKPPCKAGGRGGESTARQYLLIYIHRILAKQILLRSLKLELRISVNPLQYPSIWLLSM
ncbi:hypothetical protein D5I93_02545 [Escherichia coli]|nr:hypothetical protein BFL18_28270 [Escherichia coli]AST49988.1 hypothetical protein A8V31_31605 [Escherichia coli O157:H7]QKA71456.1 hypothetical protein E4U83_25380 [Escherichia coli O157:H7 str. F8092B]EAC0748215.1 hypothetical protein [Escherichia coli]EEU9247046.1 hypothetical protein [Escherichia coli O157:H7]